MLTKLMNWITGKTLAQCPKCLKKTRELVQSVKHDKHYRYVCWRCERDFQSEKAKSGNLRG
jgi:transposase-like protein